jgi:hypothetical protein
MAATNSVNMDTDGIQTFDASTGDLTGSVSTQFNVLLGDVTNKLTNVAPSATSGVPLISSGAAVNPAFGTMVVAGGGTGNTTFTAFSVICAGTTATGVFQNVSGVGNVGQILTSNGAGALPTWQGSGSGYSLQMQVGTANASTITYFFAYGQTINTSTASGGILQKITVPRSGTITACFGSFIVSALGGAGNDTLVLRINNTTDVVVSNTIVLSGAGTFPFGTSALSQAVTAGDYIEVKFTCASSVNCNCSLSILIT